MRLCRNAGGLEGPYRLAEALEHNAKLRPCHKEVTATSLSVRFQGGQGYDVYSNALSPGFWLGEDILENCLS